MKYCTSCNKLWFRGKPKCSCNSETGSMVLKNFKKPKPSHTHYEKEANEFLNIKCQNCKNKRVTVSTKLTRAADEAPTRYYKCHSCKHCWLEY